MIYFTPSNLHTVEDILRTHDELQNAVRTLRLLAFECRPESDEWQTACLVGDIEIMIEDDDMIGAGLLIPRAVRQMNALNEERVAMYGDAE